MRKSGWLKPALASLGACEKQYMTVVENMGSEARGARVQVPDFPFTRYRILDFLNGLVFQFLHLGIGGWGCWEQQYLPIGLLRGWNLRLSHA